MRRGRRLPPDLGGADTHAGIQAEVQLRQGCLARCPEAHLEVQGERLARLDPHLATQTAKIREGEVAGVLLCSEPSFADRQVVRGRGDNADEGGTAKRGQPDRDRPTAWTRAAVVAGMQRRRREQERNGEQHQ